MEELFKELAWKAYQKKLSFDASCNGSIYIFHKNDLGDMKVISSGYVKDWEFETPAEVLERMHQEVDQFIGKQPMEDMENVYFERPRGVSFDEIKMKEAGHKEGDFE